MEYKDTQLYKNTISREEAERDYAPVTMTRGQYNVIKEKIQAPLVEKLDKITEHIDHYYKRIHSDIKAPKDIYITAILQIKDILEDKE